MKSSSRSWTPDLKKVPPPPTEEGPRLVDAFRRRRVLIEADYSGLEMAILRQVARDLVPR